MRKKGTVSRAGKSKFSYFLQLDGEDFYYNTKFKPKCGEGDVVGIEFDQKADNRGQVKNVKVFEDNSGGYDASNSESPQSGGGGGGSFGGSKPQSGGGGDRQDSIIWQHSQEMACRVADVLFAAGTLASKGNTESKREEILSTVDELTVRYFDDASNPKGCAAYKTVRGIQEDAGEDTPDKKDESWDEEEESWD
jgi:hypothetical protein